MSFRRQRTDELGIRSVGMLGVKSGMHSGFDMLALARKHATRRARFPYIFDSDIL